MCSAVKPDRSSFGSAPASSSADGQLEMAVLDGQDQRSGRLSGRGPPGDLWGCMASLTSAPAASRPQRRLGPALAHGEEQGREAGGQRSRGNRPPPGAAPRPPPRSLRPPPTSGPSALASLALTSAPRASNAFTGPSLPVRAAVIKAVSSPGSFVVRVGPGLEQELDHRLVAVRAGQRQRRHAVAVRGLDVGPGGDRSFAISRSS